MIRVFDCGCVEGQYWCSRHDIYRRQKPNDLPPHGDPRGRGRGAKFAPPDGCSCHISAPCSYCTSDEDDEKEPEPPYDYDQEPNM